MRRIVDKLLYLMTAPEKRQLLVLLAVSLCAAVLEGVGLGVIFVFLKVITDVTDLGGIAFLQEWRSAMPGTSDSTFLLLCLLAMLIFFFVRQAVIFLSAVFNSALRKKIQLRIAGEIYSSCILEAYGSPRQLTTAQVVTLVMTNVSMAVYHGIVGLVEITSAILMLIGIVVMILQIKPFESAAGMMLAGLFAVAYWYLMRDRILRWGKEKLRAMEESYRVVGESMRGIKTIKVLGVENESIAMFDGVLKVQADITFKYMIAQQFPNAFLQFTIVSLVIGMMALMIATG